MSNGSHHVADAVPRQQPVTEDDLYILFLALARFPAFYQEWHEQLRAEHFNPAAEAHWRLLWQGIHLAYQQYRDASHDTVWHVMNGLLNDGTAAVSQEQYQALVSRDADGIVWNIYMTPVEHLTEGVVLAAREMAQRFLYERTVLEPLRHLVASGFGAASYPSTVADTLQSLIQREQRLRSGSVLPAVDLAPAPGTELVPAADYVPTGLAWFDERFTGQQRQDVVGVIGVTGGGKTTLGVHVAVTLGRRAFTEEGHRGEQVLYFSFEETVRRLRPRFQAAAFGIPRETLEVLRDVNDLSRIRLPYEQAMCATASGELPSEFDRYVLGMEWLNSSVVGFDMVGDEVPGVGQGYVPEIAQMATMHQQRTGRGVRAVIIDWAGVACDRYRTAMGKPDSELRHLLRAFGEACRLQIAIPLNTTVWILHQIAGAACNLSPAKLLHHNDAAEAKSFADNLSLCMCIGNPDRNSGCRLMNFSKVRNKPVERIAPLLFSIHEQFARIEDMSDTMAVDGSGARIVSRADLAHVLGATGARGASAGPTGLNQAARTRSVALPTRTNIEV
jgi:hypothetical protein